MEYTEYKKPTGFRISGKPETSYLDGHHDTLGGPGGSHTSQLDLIAVSRASNKAGFLYNYFVTWEDDKTVFSIPGDAEIVPHSSLCPPTLEDPQ